MSESMSKFENTDVIVQYKGTKITLPDDPVKMSTREAIKCLERKEKQDETVVAIHEEIDAYPLDGAYALMQTLKSIYGWADAVPTPGFFGPQPPVMVNMEVGFGESVQVLWGRFEIPGVDGNISTSATHKNGKFIFVIAGEVKQKEKAVVKRIADQVREYVKHNSVYKGKAVRLRTDDDGEFSPESAPVFMDLSKVNPDELVFSDDVDEQIRTNLFAPILYTEVCRKHKIPLKRGVLLEGPYGTGKTLTAYVCALLASRNNWTFIYLDRVSALDEALIFARQYAPAVVFAEDIDRVTNGERDVDLDDVLNNIDGIESKGSDIITILTSNHADTINKAMLRPGRLDAIIHVAPPDETAVKKLFRLYARDLIKEDENLDAAAKELAGHIPAVIREAVERSKLYAIERRSGDDEGLVLRGSDLTNAAKGMQRHFELLKGDSELPPTPEEQVGQGITGIVKELLGGDFIKKVRDTEDGVTAIRAKFGV